VRERGRFEPGREILCDRAPANNRSSLEEERLAPGLCEIERSDQSIVPGSDHHHIVPSHFRAVSFKIRIAAFRPGAPMIPPPGCVAEPHI
jgi:hypothetical protein